MGEWAHPDDDTSIIGPCGVWHHRYGTRCGIIQVTRGEGGGNATGTESGTALGLRRENEDRVAHYRSGTTDIYYVDRVDFFYNQSAPLTNLIWDHQETLRRVTRIIRTTQPDIYVGYTPTLDAGHGNHQVAGRLIWEGMQAAADPSMFPDQLRGKHPLSTWQVKKVFSGGSTAGTGGTTTAANCTRGFLPAASNPDTIAGVWTGGPSPYLWPKGNLQGQPVGTPKIWQQVSDEGSSAYPTQSRVMYQGVSAPGCPKFAMTDSFVPFQPNTLSAGAPNPAAGSDAAILDGATRRDPGGLPLGTGEHLTVSRFYNVPGIRFHATLHLSADDVALRAGRVRLRVPDGWQVNGSRHIPRIAAHHSRTVRFAVTPGADASVGQDAKISALYRAAGRTGYTDQVVQMVPAVEGRMHRIGKWAEYDDWLTSTAPAAQRLGRSSAVTTIGTGKTITLPVEVHNRSDAVQSGTVSLDLPGRLNAARTSAAYSDLAPGESTQVSFALTDNGDALPADQQTTVGVTTTSSAAGSATATAGSSSEQVSVSVVPTSTVSPSTTAPTIDAKQGSGEYPGPQLDIGRLWQGANYCTSAADCGRSTDGDADHSWAKVSWHGDALYLFAHIRDDMQSYAVTPQECVAHWLADSVEFQIDPRGSASDNALDTGSTFKLGVFPFTNDPKNTNGNGANGPCWERDADNHQGYSTGPLANTVAQAPNAPGVQVASSATWVGDNQTTTDHSYAGGGYDLEVKVPTADLPASIDPAHMGLNITPYDEDDTSAAGSTTLRHIDNSTRLGWSAFNSVQSDPYRWGQTTVDGYTPPASQPTEAGAPIVGHPNLDGTMSPQTIAQSARNGVPIAGREPAARNDRIVSLTRPQLRGNSIRLTVRASGRGQAQLYGYVGNPGYTPVYTTSCSRRLDPPPDYGLTPCAQSDGGTPRWSPDMGGRLLAQRAVQLHRGFQQVTLHLDRAQVERFRRTGRVLVSFTGAHGGVQALDSQRTR